MKIYALLHIFTNICKINQDSPGFLKWASPGFFFEYDKSAAFQRLKILGQPLIKRMRRCTKFFLHQPAQRRKIPLPIQHRPEKAPNGIQFYASDLRPVKHQLRDPIGPAGVFHHHNNNAVCTPFPREALSSLRDLQQIIGWDFSFHAVLLRLFQMENFSRERIVSANNSSAPTGPTQAGKPATANDRSTT